MTTSQRTRGVVTPEAVELQFDTASVGSRALARLIDLVIEIGLLLVIFTVVALLLAGTAGAGARGRGSLAVSQAVATAAVIVATAVVLVGYPLVLEWRWGGRTVGKAVVGLRVVTADGAPLRFRHAFVRAVIGLVEVLAFTFVAVLAVALTADNQRVGDFAAGTIVLRERVAARPAVPVTFPPLPGFESYVAALDVAGMTADQYRLVRSFLVRIPDLSAEARHALAVALANSLAVALRHEPPPGVGPEPFLASAVAAYQWRHGGPGARWVPPPMGARLPAGPPSPPPAGPWSGAPPVGARPGPRPATGAVSATRP